MADQGAEGLLSPFLRRKRIEAAVPWLKGRVLDFGCGAGILAAFVDSERYLGVEVDDLSVQKARSVFPQHMFVNSLPEKALKFDTVVALAVIEHVKEPATFLYSLAELLEDNQLSRLVVTTPHPSVDWLHSIGAKVGVFSRHASDEHEELLDHVRLEMAGAEAGLKLVSYSKFLLGANQIAVYSKACV